MDDSDDDIPLAVLRRTHKKESSLPPATAGSDSDDDIPLAVLRRTQKKEASLAPAKAKKRKRPSDDDADFAPRRSTAKKKPKKKPKAASNGSSAAKRSSAASASISSGAASSNTKKHELAEGVLRRWSLCLEEWPPRTALNSGAPPKNFIASGFRGVFVGVYGGDIGKIKDKRPFNDAVPSLQKLLRRPAEELQALLLKGIDNQAAELRGLQGTTSGFGSAKLIKDLEAERRTVAKMKPAKIDKAYEKAVTNRRR